MNREKIEKIMGWIVLCLLGCWRWIKHKRNTIRLMVIYYWTIFRLRFLSSAYASGPMTVSYLRNPEGSLITTQDVTQIMKKNQSWTFFSPHLGWQMQFPEVFARNPNMTSIFQYYALDQIWWYKVRGLGPSTFPFYRAEDLLKMCEKRKFEESKCAQGRRYAYNLVARVDSTELNALELNKPKFNPDKLYWSIYLEKNIEVKIQRLQQYGLLLRAQFVGGTVGPLTTEELKSLGLDEQQKLPFPTRGCERNIQALAKTFWLKQKEFFQRAVGPTTTTSLQVYALADWTPFEESLNFKTIS